MPFNKETKPFMTAKNKEERILKDKLKVKLELMSSLIQDNQVFIRQKGMRAQSLPRAFILYYYF